MKETQLNLGIELRDRIKKMKKERKKYKKGFDHVVKLHNQSKSKVIIEVDKTFFDFPLEEFMKFLESRIIHLDSQIKELETKFEQL
jgi:hypothetical protein